MPPTLFHPPPKPNINEKMRDLLKLTWPRDVAGKVDNIHSNLSQSASGHIALYFERKIELGLKFKLRMFDMD